MCCLCIVPWLNLTSERWVIIVISDQSSSNIGRLYYMCYIVLHQTVSLLVTSIWSEFTFSKLEKKSKTLTNWVLVGEVYVLLIMSCFLNFILLLIFCVFHITHDLDLSYSKMSKHEFKYPNSTKVRPSRIDKKMQRTFSVVLFVFSLL